MLADGVSRSRVAVSVSTVPAWSGRCQETSVGSWLWRRMQTLSRTSKSIHQRRRDGACWYREEEERDSCTRSIETGCGRLEKSQSRTVSGPRTIWKHLTLYHEIIGEFGGGDSARVKKD